MSATSGNNAKDHSEKKRDKKKHKKAQREENGENGTNALANGEKHKGKSSKKRFVEEQEEENEKMTETAMEVESPSRKKKEKKSKKEKKEKRKEKKEEVEPEEIASDNTPKEKKSKKRDRENGHAENAVQEPVEQPAKKHKQRETQQMEVKEAADFKKCFYKESASLKSFSEKDVEAFRAQNNIAVTGSDCKPLRTFQDTGLPADILAVCSKFEKPTPIQSQCWPIVMSGHDIVGIAETGSGKTMAFTLPALVHIKDQRPLGRKEGPIVLILSPTRELASQIAEVTEAAGKACGFRSTCIYGGVDKGPQKAALDKGCHFVVATPGRLLDLINQGICNLKRVTYLVLDEADRMLDMGFEKDIKAIVSQIRSDRQTLMFSATWPQVIQKMASEYLINPVKVTIGSEDLSANHRVKQIVEVMEPFAKDNRLDQLLREYHKSRTNRILIFVLYKKEAVRVEQMLRKRGWKVQAIHGDASQFERTRAMNEFKDGSQPLLVATDVAARGLDIPNVEYVINFTFPLTIEDYIHRIGRTGRAGKSGVSHTLFTQHDKARTGELVQVLKEANQDVPEDLLKFGCVTKKKEHALYGSAFKATNPDAAPMPKTSHIKFD